MNSALPSFTYHPDPVGTGAFKDSDAQCICCGKERGYIYVAPVYSRRDLRDQICPWCIASGLAAERFDATFSDSVPLFQAGVPREIIDVVTKKTPGFESWQQETWLAHCGDACEFHGDAAPSDLEAISPQVKAEFLKDFFLSEDKWAAIKRHYVPKGDPAVYKFVCRHCGVMLLGMDFT